MTILQVKYSFIEVEPFYSSYCWKITIRRESKKDISFLHAYGNPFDFRPITGLKALSEIASHINIETLIKDEDRRQLERENEKRSLEYGLW